MKSKRVLFYVLAALVAGCFPVFSLQSLFTEENLTFDERLLGTWVEDANKPKQSWEFSRLGAVDPNTFEGEFKGAEDRVYRLKVQDDEMGKGVFIACLGKVGDKLFLDIFPARFPSGEQDLKKAELIYNAFFFVPVHTFVKVELVGGQLKMRLTDDDKFKDLMKAEPNAIQYQKVDSQTVLTASTKDLQAFVTKHANDERLFSDEKILSRKPSK